MEAKTEGLMNITDAAHYLQTSRTTVYRYIHMRQDPLPVHNLPGGGYRIRQGELDSWLDRQSLCTC